MNQKELAKAWRRGSEEDREVLQKLFGTPKDFIADYKPVVKNTLKEYYLLIITVCLVCKKKTEEYYFMGEEESCLHSKSVTKQEVDKTLKVEKQVRITAYCPACRAFFMAKEKEELVDYILKRGGKEEEVQLRSILDR